MGQQDVQQAEAGENQRRFMQALIKDVRALERMIEGGKIESGVRRIGAEQELFLVDGCYRPVCRADDVLEAVDDPHFTPELARFNVEFNLDPLDFGGDCLSRMEKQIHDLLAKARRNAEKLGIQIVMTGILPTLKMSDLGLESMTPRPRYFALNDAMTRLRGGPYTFRIKGNDELMVQHDSVMLESCNTSFQAHFQVSAEEFARFYNIAQAATAPVMAVSSNSPLLFGKRLWRETRIALFQQSVDTRPQVDHRREMEPRVSFGKGWIRDSVLEIFREDISRFRVLVGGDIDRDPEAELEAGRLPSLSALRMHNSTVYRWNRPCFGVAGDIAHLRIENRVIPSGPTPRDEVANAALWFGLVSGLVEEYGDITNHMSFEDAASNFIASARIGIDSHFTWVGGESVSARRLVADRLLPLAREGLAHSGVDKSDIDCYLGVIEERVKNGQTGARWILDSLSGFRDECSPDECLRAITSASMAREMEGSPVHDWPLARPDEAGEWKTGFIRVEQYMTTDLFTVNENEVIDLVASMMDWQHIRHVPVEDDEHRLVGIVSHRTLLRFLANQVTKGAGEPVAVKTIMQRDPISVSPETHTLDVIDLMRRERISCLPVVKGRELVGIVTDRDFLRVAAQVLEQHLGPERKSEGNPDQEREEKSEGSSGCAE